MKERNIILIAIVMLHVACSRDERERERTRERTYEPEAICATGRAGEGGEDRDSTFQIELTGVVVADPQRTQRLVAPIGGIVEEFRIMKGDEVRKGQKVARLVGSEVSALSIQLREAEGEYHVAQRDRELKKMLYDDGLVSEQEYKDSEERYEVAKAAIKQWATISNGEIKTTIRGTLLESRVVNGQYVEPGELLMEIVDLDEVWVLADVYEGDISRVAEGDSVQVWTLSYPEEKREGVIDKIYQVLDKESKTMKVRITLRNQRHHLLPGMYANVRVTIGSNKR